MSTEDDFDYWVDGLATERPVVEQPVEIKTVTGIMPLDDQLGIDVPKTVPDALHKLFFDQPEANDPQLALTDNDPEALSPYRIYAILDAAKIVNLPELLETSGLPHRCLFKGNAYDELKDVAPWIVQLEDGNSFTRNLFTASDAPWHLWDKEPGIYIRSRGTLEDMWNHFRKFTRVQDETGKWFYFRFWEPKVMARYCYEHSHEANQHFTGFVSGNSLVFLDLYRKVAVVAKGNSTIRLDTLWPSLKNDLAPIKLALFCEDWADRIVDVLPSLGEIPQPDRLTRVTDMVLSARKAGFRLQKSVERYTLATFLLGQRPEALDAMAGVINGAQHELDRSRKLLTLAQESKQEG